MASGTLEENPGPFVTSWTPVKTPCSTAASSCLVPIGNTVACTCWFVVFGTSATTPGSFGADSFEMAVAERNTPLVVLETHVVRR